VCKFFPLNTASFRNLIILTDEVTVPASDSDVNGYVRDEGARLLASYTIQSISMKTLQLPLNGGLGARSRFGPMGAIEFKDLT
jgi:hypothetical protein